MFSLPYTPIDIPKGVTPFLGGVPFVYLNDP